MNDIMIFAAPDGSSAVGDGSRERPYHSVKEAQEAVREILAGGGSGDICVCFAGGRYYIGSPIVIGPDDCRAGRRVIYMSAPGERACLVGGVTVSGWTGPDKDGIFSADFPGADRIYALYENGRRLIPARETEWKGKPVRDPSHLQAVHGSPTGWFGEILKVSSFDGSEAVTEIESCPFSGPVTYLQGAREYISEPGEWAAEGSRLYLRPMDPGGFMSAEIVAGTADEIFALRGDGERPVTDVVISGLDLTMNAFGGNLAAHARPGNVTAEFGFNLKALVSLENCEKAEVRNCRMSQAGYTAVTLRGRNSGNIIAGNDISETGYAGIYLFGENPGSLNFCSRGNTVSDNRIRDVGTLVGHGAGIYLMNSGENLITHNEISGVPRYGVSMKGIRYGVFSDNGIDVPFADHWKYNQTTKNVISYNIIHDTGRASADGGGVEGWGIGRDNVIDRNIIYNAYRGRAMKGWRGHAVFLDDAAHYAAVTNNIIYDTSAPAVNAAVFIKSIGCVVRNNVFDIGFEKDGAANIRPYICPCGHSVFEKNIVYSSVRVGIGDDGTADGDSDAGRVMLTIGDDSNGTGTSAFDSLDVMDRNVYYNAEGMALFSVNGRTLTLDEWKSCPENRNGYDASSVSADPLFADPAGRDYRISDDSPARALGIEPIDASQIGLTDAFPF